MPESTPHAFLGFLIQYTIAIKNTHTEGKTNQMVSTTSSLKPKSPIKERMAMVANNPPTLAATSLLVLPNLVFSRYFLLAGIFGISFQFLNYLKKVLEEELEKPVLATRRDPQRFLWQDQKHL